MASWPAGVRNKPRCAVRVLGQLVDEFHDGRDGRVEGEPLDVLGDLLDGAVRPVAEIRESYFVLPPPGRSSKLFIAT